MAEDVSIRIRLLERLKFQRDAALAQKSVDEIGDEAAQASRRMATLGTFGKTVGTSLARGLKYGAVAGATALAAVGVGAVNYASSLGESVSKANVIFAKHAGVVQKWSKGMADNFGVSREEALEASSGYMAMFKSGGIAAGAATKMSIATSELAADMASMHNADPTEMLDKLRAGLSGEAEPLRRFGVFLSEAAVQTEAVRMGIAKQGEELTDAQKIQARYNIIMAQTKDAQGDVARTAQSLPNVMRRVKAQVKDTLAGIGGELLPGIGKGLATLSKAILPAIKGLGEPLGEIVGALGTALGPVIQALTPIISIFANVLAKIAVAAAPLVELLGKVLSRTLKALMPAIGPLIEALQEGLWEVLDALLPVLPDVARGVVAIVKAVVPLIPLLGKLLAFGVKFAGPIIQALANVLEWLGPKVATILEFVSGAVIVIVNTVIDAINWVIRAANKIPGTKIDEISPIELDVASGGSVPGAGMGGGDLQHNRHQGGTGNVPGLATGGTAMAHRPYIVGERGPELLVPRITSTVLPNHEVRNRGGDGAGLEWGSGFTWTGDLIVEGAGDPEAVAEAVIRKLQDKAARL